MSTPSAVDSLPAVAVVPRIEQGRLATARALALRAGRRQDGRVQRSAGVPDAVEAGDKTQVQLEGLESGQLLRRTDKAVTSAGRWHGYEVVVKQLTSGDPHWTRRFAHEIAAYRAFAGSMPPWRVPRLYHVGQDVLVIERLPGEPPHTDRYPPRLPGSIVTAMLDALTVFAGWDPPDGPLRAQATDWPARIRRYVAAGDLPAQDLTALLGAVTGAPAQFGHGDPLTSNALIAEHHRLTFIDYEFAGLYPAGADLALLGIWLGRHDPDTARRCAERAAAGGHQHSYAAMRVLWLARERRLYQDVFAATDDHDEHRQWLDAQASDAIAAFGRGSLHG